MPSWTRWRAGGARTVRLHSTALAQLDALESWWRENRPAAATQVVEEVARLVGLLREAPYVGVPYGHASVPGTRVVRLRRTPYRHYYVHDVDAGEIVVLAAWSALRGQGPPI